METRERWLRNARRKCTVCFSMTYYLASCSASMGKHRDTESNDHFCTGDPVLHSRTANYETYADQNTMLRRPFAISLNFGATWEVKDATLNRATFLARLSNTILSYRKFHFRIVSAPSKSRRKRFNNGANYARKHF